MKSLVCAVVAAAALSASFGAVAQTDAPLTRAQVREELVQLEKAGYKLDSSGPFYPAEFQAAQARANTEDASGIGSQVAPGVHAGRPATAVRVPDNSIFFGH
jgi:hypothetical protein